MRDLRIPTATVCAIVFLTPSLTASAGDQLFDMEPICDPGTLAIAVLTDWHIVDGPVATRQKLVTINVGEFWPGQDYRVPVRMVVPVDRKAKGFHLTGGHGPGPLQRDARPNPFETALLKHGVGLVNTVVQEPGSYGQGRLGGTSESRFARTLNPHDKIQYWAWPATLMRAITTAYAETEHFEQGRVAVTGSSKNGASPSMAILHDERMTAVHASVSPIWDSPLRLCDAATRKLHEAAGGKQRGFSGGHFGPNFNQAALDAGHTWEELQKFTANISDGVFISRNLPALKRRGVEMLFHPGTHDLVAYDLAWGGSHHPDIPIYLGANTGHGKEGHPQLERDQRNRDAFLLRHFFPENVEPLLTAPVVEHKVAAGTLKVTVRFPADSGEDRGRIFWMDDRAPDGSPDYLRQLIPDENTAEMIHDAQRGVWTADIRIDANVSRVDFFSNHRKRIRFEGETFNTYLSSPYTRVEL